MTSSDIERDDMLAEREHDEIRDTTCPHCLEPIGGESAGAMGDGPWFHNVCMEGSEYRTTEVQQSLHRLSEPELAAVLKYAVELEEKKYPTHPLAKVFDLGTKAVRKQLAQQRASAKQPPRERLHDLAHRAIRATENRTLCTGCVTCQRALQTNEEWFCCDACLEQFMVDMANVALATPKAE